MPIAVESPARRLSRQAADLIREFLLLNRRRFHPGPALTARERQRWEELRWQIEELLSARGHGRRPERKALRVPTELKVEYCDRDCPVLATAHEIAEDGLFLATDGPPAIGAALHLKIVGEDGQTIEVEGTVTWLRRVGERGGPPGIGVEFAHLDAQQREDVAHLVEQALAAL